MQWLRDALKMIASAPDVNALAARADPAEQVYLVPAFVGLGAPWWDARCARRGLRAHAQFAASPNSRAPRSKRSATRPAICSRPCAPTGRPAGDTVLRVDGGMAASDVTMQFLADILAAPVDRPAVMETTALGAGLSRGPRRRRLPGPRRISRRAGRCERRFLPQMDAATRERKWAGWRDAVARTLSEG